MHTGTVSKIEMKGKKGIYAAGIVMLIIFARLL